MIQYRMRYPKREKAMFSILLMILEYRTLNVLF
jgi:hypothetical protein